MRALSILSILFKFIAPVLAALLARGSVKATELKKEAEQAAHDAQKYADAKYTRASKRLRALAAAKRKNRS